MKDPNLQGIGPQFEILKVSRKILFYSCCTEANYVIYVWAWRNWVNFLNMLWSYSASFIKSNCRHAILVTIFKNGDGVSCGGVPHTNGRILPRLACCDQCSVRMKCQALKETNYKINMKQSKFSYFLILVCVHFIRPCNRNNKILCYYLLHNVLKCIVSGIYSINKRIMNIHNKISFNLILHSFQYHCFEPAFMTIWKYWHIRKFWIEDLTRG